MKPIRSTRKRQLILLLAKLYNNRCYYCGITLELANDFKGNKLPTNAVTLDHIIPISKNGTHELENLVPSCHHCNHIKSSYSIKNFRKLKELPYVFYGEILKSYKKADRRKWLTAFLLALILIEVNENGTGKKSRNKFRN